MSLDDPALQDCNSYQRHTICPTPIKQNLHVSSIPDEEPPIDIASLLSDPKVKQLLSLVSSKANAAGTCNMSSSLSALISLSSNYDTGAGSTFPQRASTGNAVSACNPSDDAVITKKLILENGNSSAPSFSPSTTVLSTGGEINNMFQSVAEVPEFFPIPKILPSSTNTCNSSTDPASSAEKVKISESDDFDSEVIYSEGDSKKKFISIFIYSTNMQKTSKEIFFS